MSAATACFKKSVFIPHDWCRKERQAIYAEVGKHLATLDLHQRRRQPIYASFEEDSTLDCFPTWQRERMRGEGNFIVPNGDDDDSSS